MVPEAVHERQTPRRRSTGTGPGRVPPFQDRPGVQPAGTFQPLPSAISLQVGQIG